MNQRDRYNQVIYDRQIDSFNRSGEGVRDFTSGANEPGVGREALEAAQLKSAAQATDKGSPVESAAAQVAAPQASAPSMGAVQPQGSAMATIGQAGMMSGNPYLMGAGLGLQVLAQGEANKRQQEEAQRQAYNDRIRDRQEKMAMIASMGIQ